MTILQAAPLALHLMVMLVLSIYAAHAYLMVFLYRRNGRTANVPATDLAEWPTVTVQLPLFNEKYVVARLINAVCQLEYPRTRLEIQILDDSTDETQQIAKELVDDWHAAGVDIVYLHRTDRQGYKAGALREGLAVAKGEYLALFDADFVPPTNFLERIMPRFDAPDIGAIQARWGHLNDESNMLTRSIAIGLDAHFAIEHTARNTSGLFINFNGTAGVWRKETILDAGNWQSDTLTEDLDLSYRAQILGWRFLYADDVVCPAEIPADVRGLKTQQYRWTKGAIQTARKILPRLWRKPGLPLKVKLEGTIHLTHNLVFPVMLTLSLMSGPLMFLQENVPASRQYFILASTFVIWSFSYPVFYAEAQRRIYPDWRRRLLHLPGLMACAVGMSIVNTKAVISGLLNRTSPFVRTPKYSLANKTVLATDRPYRPKIDYTALIELLMATYLVAIVVYGVSRQNFSIVPLLVLPVWGFSWIGWQSWRNSRVAVVLVGALLVAPGVASAQTNLVNVLGDGSDRLALPMCGAPNLPTVCFDFEGPDTMGWICPEWFIDTNTYVLCAVEVTEGSSWEDAGKALRLQFDSVEKRWFATGVELAGSMNLAPYIALESEIFLADMPPNTVVAARYVVVAGSSHQWFQSRQKTVLRANRWVTMTVPMGDALSWSTATEYWGENAADLMVNLDDVSKIMIRIEVVASGAASPVDSYSYDVLIDNLTLSPTTQ